jgi:hypothetical protein
MSDAALMVLSAAALMSDAALMVLSAAALMSDAALMVLSAEGACVELLGPPHAASASTQAASAACDRLIARTIPCHFVEATGICRYASNHA